MNPRATPMRQLRLITIDGPLLAAFRTSPAALESHLGASIGAAIEIVAPMLEQTEKLFAAKPRDPKWGCFVAVDPDLGQVIGACGFKDAPDANGMVEIAYTAFPGFEGKGYATALAAELTARGAGQKVIAHTLPERNASCRVLEKNGFTFTGGVVDPEDGPVWRWEKLE